MVVGLLLLRGICRGFFGWRPVAWFLLGSWCPCIAENFEIFPSPSIAGDKKSSRKLSQDVAVFFCINFTSGATNFAYDGFSR